MLSWSTGKRAEGRARRWEPSVLPESEVWEPGQPFMAVRANLMPKGQSFEDLNILASTVFIFDPSITHSNQLFFSLNEIMLEERPGKLSMLIKQ